jgi:hypothetical protein
MKKTVLTVCILIYALGLAAQWNLQEDHRLTVDGNSLSFEARVNKDGITFVPFWKLEPEDSRLQGNRYSDNVDFVYYLQIVDRDGENLLPDAGKLISHRPTRSFAMGDDQAVLTDSDGNALLIVKDERNWPSGYPNQSYFVYKVSPEGEFLWDEPLDLNRGNAYYLVSNIKVIELSDGSYAFAHEIHISEGYAYIAIDKVSKSGEFIWEEPLLLEDDELSYGYPLLADGGSSSLIVAYYKTP